MLGVHLFLCRYNDLVSRLNDLLSHLNDLASGRLSISTFLAFLKGIVLKIVMTKVKYFKFQFGLSLVVNNNITKFEIIPLRL